MTSMTDYRALKRNLANKELVALAIVYVFYLGHHLSNTLTKA